MLGVQRRDMIRKLSLERVATGMGVCLLTWGVLSLHNSYKTVRWLALESQRHPNYLSKIESMPENLHYSLLAVFLSTVFFGLSNWCFRRAKRNA